MYLNEFHIDKSSLKDYLCKACITGKLHVSLFPKRSLTKCSHVGEHIVMGVWGTAPTRLLQESEYFITFIDKFSCLCIVYFIKSTKEVRTCHKDSEALLDTQLGAKIKQVCLDNGKEYLNKELKDHAESGRTIFKQTTPHSSSWNRIAKQMHWHLMDYTWASLAQHSLPKFLWQEAVAHIHYVRNRLMTRAMGVTPYKCFYGKALPLRCMDKFGLKIWVLDQSGKNQKLDLRANTYSFMGFGESPCTYQYWKVESHQVLVSRNVSQPNLWVTRIKNEISELFE